MATCKECASEPCEHDERCDDCGKCLTCSEPNSPPMMPWIGPSSDGWVKRKPVLQCGETYEKYGNRLESARTNFYVH